jgi:glycosyltransferase involved in cell wall biosynthesis
MKVALVHDWLTGMRGGERVLLSLARLFPGAPIFTLLHLPGSVDPELEARPIHATFAQRLPALQTHYRRYLPLFPAAASTWDLRGYDLVVSSSHCVAKAARPGAGAVHVCYCHTPMRYLWDRYDDYFGPGRARWATRAGMAALRPWLQRWDRRTAARVHRFAANSAYVAARIARHYERESEVIPPPIDTDFFTPGGSGAGDYDLVVSALAPYKRLDVVLEAYRGLDWPLKIVGWGPENARLKRLAPPNAGFLGRVDDLSLRDLYRGCRAVVMAGVEDFGMAPLEAMACGRPAVVFAEGGGLESVVPGKTGLLYHEPTAPALRAVVSSLAARRFDVAALRAHAESFSRAVFEARFRAFVERCLERALTGSSTSSGARTSMPA